MLIDWFTVIAQVLNFLVLVWLLRRFLYGPILRAVDARETGIAATLAEAEAKRSEAQTERDHFEQKDRAFEEGRMELLRNATAEAEAERERLLVAARRDADAVRSEWRDALREEQDALGEEIARRARQGVFDIVRKTLAELASVPLEACMGGVFIARLRGLDGAAHDRLAAALRTAAGPALVRSAFDLPPAQRSEIEAAVRETFAVESPLRFETAPGLVSGIELTANGQKVAWSISDSLASLEKTIGDLLDEKTAPVAQAVSR